MNRNLPGGEFQLHSISDDPVVRHEQLLDLFGSLLFWMRNRAAARVRELIESSPARDAIGTIRRRHFDVIAGLKADERQSAAAIAESAIDRFCDALLRLIGNEGTDLRVGSGEAIQFLLTLQFIHVDSGEIAESEVINRDGQKALPSYWGRWLNRFRNTDVPPNADDAAM
jgi:hypothetical protein